MPGGSLVRLQVARTCAAWAVQPLPSTAHAVARQCSVNRPRAGSNPPPNSINVCGVPAVDGIDGNA